MRRERGGESLAPKSFFTDFFSDVDRFFENDLFRMPAQIGRQLMRNMPATNIRESEKEYTIELAAPGMTKEDFNIDVDEGMLTISSQKEEDNSQVEENFTRREYNYSSFSRSFRLPDAVNAEEIKARYEEGVLKISVPKREESGNNRKRVNID
ncbi:Hsp20/alpha crystallin family protein [Pontibacter sp. JH31]|uniref:Hsp20/alpha crystallin family protein n=1 Tax=Pontibacter aquaedesilientis TaxID=2766980 RepID=A0ABR7XG91_9BACT|nr:Hsp20/alpha crystallin family protein [Pontibacter aquaedesilientis]MBD1397309.1 Hsp20/alpha crystallin family protein [Pontibacter aquaedesilientis]